MLIPRPRLALASASVAAALLSSCAHRQTISASAPKPAISAGIHKQIVNAVEAGDGDYQLRLLRARLDSNPKDLPLRLELASRYRQLGFPEIALEHCRLACERFPDSDDAHIALAKALRDEEHAAEAIGLLSAFTASHAAATASTWAWLGILQDDAEDWKAGELSHRKALALDGARDEFHNNLGYCLLRQGKHAEAAQEFRAALRLHPHSAIAENNLALALAGRTEAENKEAVARMQSVADPATAHNNMAVALMESGKYAEARQEIALALGYNRAHQAALSNMQLLANLEGREAQVPAAAPPRRIWARVWDRFRGYTHSPSPNPQKTNDSGSPVASR